MEKFFDKITEGRLQDVWIGLCYCGFLLLIGMIMAEPLLKALE